MNRSIAYIYVLCVFVNIRWLCRDTFGLPQDKRINGELHETITDQFQVLIPFEMI